MTQSNFTESMNNAIQALSQAAKIASEINARLTVSCSNYINDIISDYPNKRVVYLALHHPKERVRKKNIHRIMKYINHKQIVEV